MSVLWESCRNLLPKPVNFRMVVMKVKISPLTKTVVSRTLLSFTSFFAPNFEETH